MNLFPVISPAERRAYLAEGKSRLADRIARQNNSRLTHHENTKKQQTLLLRRSLDAVPVLQHDPRGSNL